MSTWNRSQTLKLINLLKINKILYDIHDVNYKNKYLREKAVTEIAKEISECKPDCTANEIKLKIKTLRSQFTRENKLVRATKRSGSGTDDVHTPKLWCYNDLTFLKNYKDDIVGESSINLDPCSILHAESIEERTVSSQINELIPKSQTTRKQTAFLEKKAQASFELAENLAAQISKKDDLKATPQRSLGLFIERELMEVSPKIFKEVKWKIIDLIKWAQDEQEKQEVQIKARNCGECPSSEVQFPRNTPIKLQNPIEKVKILRVEVLNKAFSEEEMQGKEDYLYSESVTDDSNSNENLMENTMEGIFDENDLNEFVY